MLLLLLEAPFSPEAALLPADVSDCSNWRLLCCSSRLSFWPLISSSACVSLCSPLRTPQQGRSTFAAPAIVSSSAKSHPSGSPVPGLTGESTAGAARRLRVSQSKLHPLSARCRGRSLQADWIGCSSPASARVLDALLGFHARCGLS